MQTAGQVESNLETLSKHGQSIWLDFIRRSFVRDGELRRLVEEDGLRGVTSNPSIFEKAIAGSDDYEEQMDELASDRTLDANDIYERLAIQDIQEACDTLKGVWDETVGRDGYVSMEVSPLLASKTDDTIEEARRLWKAVDRPNLMIKVPGTEEGIPAVRTLISEGINVNVTLLFGQKTYKKVAEAYMEGLEAYAKGNDDLGAIASVASFFVSRIDSAVDGALEELIEKTDSEKDRKAAGHLRGKIAIANAKMAYQIYRELFTSERWKGLVEKGARPQRLLWASTSTKNPEYPDTLYVDQLIGNETVNTLPLNTLEAFKDHGTASESLEKATEEAKEQLETLENLGISLDDITAALVDAGVQSFASAFRKLLAAVEEKRRENLPRLDDSMISNLPEELAARLNEAADEWQEQSRVKKLWSGDNQLWTSSDENEWLGWLTIVERQLEEVKKFSELADEVRQTGFKHVLLMGMGGSSLAPEVVSLTFPRMDGFPELRILDSTDPARVRSIERSLELESTLFVVASKSGTTLEPNIFLAYFLERMKEEVGESKAGKHFIAITDPGSKLEELARAEEFRQVFYGLPSIGGRYSALSDFGMIPSAMMGVEVERLLKLASEMADACAPVVPVQENPGVMLGLTLGIAANQGRDKLTLLTSEGIHDLGAWLEQLVAESTGKEGKAVIPVDRELLGSPESYGSDRLFVYLYLEDEQGDSTVEDALTAIEENGHPVVRICVADRYHIGQEFFRWEIATAVAGSVLGINPFNQPDVEASKVATRALTKAFETAGSLPPEAPFFEEESIKVFADQRNASALGQKLGEEPSLIEILKNHLARIEARDYFALLAYVEMNEANERLLQNIRHAVRDSKKVATCLGFGPRFLHSTGQAYKGGPDTGVFIQITSAHEEDLPVPGHDYTFGVVIDAQARGDLEVLSDRNRRVLRLHITGDVAQGLRGLQTALTHALS